MDNPCAGRVFWNSCFPGAPSSLLLLVERMLLVAMPGAPSSILAPRSLAIFSHAADSQNTEPFFVAHTNRFHGPLLFQATVTHDLVKEPSVAHASELRVALYACYSKLCVHGGQCISQGHCGSTHPQAKAMDQCQTETTSKKHENRTLYKGMPETRGTHNSCSSSYI